MLIMCNKMMWIFYLYLLVLVSVDSEIVNFCEIPENITSTNPCTDRNHIFMAPGVLTAGGSNRACVSRFHHQGPARLLLTLSTGDREIATAFRELPAGDGGCVDISVPQVPNTKAELVVNLRYMLAQCTWERRVSLRVSGGRVVVVHTERARYRPGDTLRARVFVLKADLTPAHGVIDEMWVEGSRGAWLGARVAQWRNLRTRLGIAHVQHELDELAPPGRWAVRVRLADGSQGSAAFSVGNYELPPFQLSVRHAPRVLRTSDRLVWTVCVRYPWTEAVEGMLVIRIRGAGAVGATSHDVGAGIRTAVRLRAPRACHRHAAAARRIGLDGANPPDVVVADFSFQEESTRIWQNTTVVSQVVDKAVSLEFLTKHRAVISPRLPYKLKIKATRWDDKPASNERVRVCRSPASHPSELAEVTSSTLADGCDDAVTDVSGIARVMFTAYDDGSAYYKFQATLQNDTSITSTSLYLPVLRTGTVHAALGPLRTDSKSARTFVPLYLNIRNVGTAITVHFVVITRGGIIYRWGATTQCPVTNSGNQIQTASRNSPCNANLDRQDTNIAAFDTYVARLDANATKLETNAAKLDANVSDALLDRHLLRVMLPIKVTHQMCPDSQLVTYFYHNEELVSASKHFEMEECFANKVDASWQTRHTPPGSTTSLHITTVGPAVCALTALDTAAKWVQPGSSLKDILMGGLRRLIDGHRNLTEYDAAGECFLTSDTPDTPSTSLELTASWLAAGGVRILGGDVIRKYCRMPAASALIDDEVTVPRSDFSEAWLWRLVTVGANGTAVTSARAPDSITRFEATATCVSRTGVAISPPTVLQVFREFFIHADSPRRLRRGDTTFIRYRLFNYLYEPLSVQIQILTDPHLEGPSNYVESACIAARSSIARRVEVRAKIPGNARLSVRAKSVRDGSCVNATAKSGVSDEVIIQMLVEPEGIPVQEQKSALLCGKGSTESSISEIFWTWPAVQTVPGTESLTVWAVGDITGPLLADADDLVLLPRGCGEQNMARLATNLLALKQLDPHSTGASVAREHVARGFTRQLQYVHPSGGFSAFGASDTTASTWLTAFAVRYLRRAHQTLTPGLPAPPALDHAEEWLLKQQMENGCFRNEGQVFHRELRGGLNEEGEIASVALTAYVITSLAESSSTFPSRLIRNTLSCLRALPPIKIKTPIRVYAHSLLAYAFMRLRKYEVEVKGVNEASFWEKRGEGREVEGLEQDEEMRQLVDLLKMARRSGDFVWWETGSLSTSIEATGYALLALAGCPQELRDTSCAHDARAAIRWLSTHRNAAGGFVATQDTLVALEALISWSSVQPSTPTRLNVTAYSNGAIKTVSLWPADKVPDIMNMGTGDQVNVRVEGTGCALIQTTRSYNAYSTDKSQQQLSVQLSVHTDGAFNCDVNETSCFCAAVVEACVVWSAAFPEMALLEVSLPGGFGVDAALLYSQLQQSSTLLRRIELSPNSGRATLYLGTRDGSDTLGHGGHQCYNFHAVGPRAKTKAAHARVMDYYRPIVNDTQVYTIPEDCPPRISHESNQYLASDNLFNKAKSLTDSGEVIITHDFSFEDIPDGIPLEDPMYDNLTQDKSKSSDKNNEIPELVINIQDTDQLFATPDSNGSVKTDKSDDFNKNLGTERNIIEHVNNDTRNVSIETINCNTNSEAEIALTTESTSHLNTNDQEFSNTDIRKEETTVEYKTKPVIEISKSHLEKIREPIITKQPNQETDTIRKVKHDFKKDTSAQDTEIDNPNLSSFHVIESDKDLEVPTGIEGPIPAIVLPPSSYPRSYVGPDTTQAGIVFNNIPWRASYRENPKNYETFRLPPYYYQLYDDSYLRIVRFRR